MGLLDCSSQEKFNRLVKWFVILASISMYVTLFIPYNGEEGVYTISAMEMAHASNYWDTTVFGIFYGRPPLLNWLIIPLAKLIGWHYVLQASRFVTATSTVLTCLTIGWFAHKITKNKAFAWLCAAMFYGEAYLMRLGWLAYSDTLSTFFTILGMVLLWWSVERKNFLSLMLALVSICLGFLVKALTPYFFYGCVGLVLLISHRNRRFLVAPSNLVVQLLAFSFPYFFAKWTNPEYFTQMLGTFIHGEHKEDLLQSWHTVPSYLYQAFIQQPIQLLLVLLPFSGVALWCLCRQKQSLVSHEYKSLAVQSAWLFLLGFLPCWLSWTQWPETRYYLPVLPFLGIAVAYLIWNSNLKIKKVTADLMIVALVIKFVLIPIGFYIRGTYFRLPYHQIAQDILVRTQGLPLAINYGYSSQGLGVASAIDEILMPEKVLPYGHAGADKPYYIVWPNCHKWGQLQSTQKIVKVYRGNHTSDYICLVKAR